MNVDRIEKMDKFPSFIKYLKISINESASWLVIFFYIAYLLSIFLVGFITMVIIFLFDYFLDKKIFNSFKIRKVKNDSN